MGHHRQSPAFVSAAWCLTYAMVHILWAVNGEPAFTGRGESFFVGGWLPVVPATLAAIVCLLMGLGVRRCWPPRRRWLLIGSGWVAGVAMMAYCFLFWIGLTMILMAPFGVPLSRNDVAVFFVRAVGVIGGFLTLWISREEFRRVRSACERCGRVHGRSPEHRTDETPRWAYLGGYLAVTGLVARMIPLVDGWMTKGGAFEGPGGVGFKLFILLMVLAGTVLPLALAHRWGRIWPAWVLSLAGRNVPRWLVLGPGLFMGVGLCLYFGLAGMSALATGRTPGDLGAVLAIGGYTVWGVGLVVASASYYRLTKPECGRSVSAV